MVINAVTKYVMRKLDRFEPFTKDVAYQLRHSLYDNWMVVDEREYKDVIRASLRRHDWEIRSESSAHQKHSA